MLWLPAIFFMNKYLFFLDIDGTLIKPNQKPNTTKLPSVIKTFLKKGALFGLNSNRSLEDVKPIYKEFGLNGPVVLENGVYFCRTIDSDKEFLILPSRNIQRISREAVESFISDEKLNCKFRYTDTVKAIKSKELSKISLGIFLNKYRKYTGSVHIFRNGERDYKLAKKLSIYLDRYLSKNGFDMLVEATKSFGNVIFWPKSASKGMALRKLKEYYSDYKFIMVGDDLADAETRGMVSHFFAVSNASAKVKESADHVSKEPYTLGVIEIIEYVYNESI